MPKAQMTAKDVTNTPVTLLLTPDQMGYLYACVEEGPQHHGRRELLRKLRVAWSGAEAAQAMLRGEKHFTDTICLTDWKG
jgi:hypothetical protein